MSDVLLKFSGVLVNTGTVAVGSVLGLLLKKAIPERLTKAVMTTIGLCTVAIGIIGILKSQNQLVMILALVPGVVIGTLLKLDDRLNSLGDRLSKHHKNGGADFSEGFVTASLLFCVGAMTIVGSVNAGISGNNQLLYTKSLLDLISSFMLASSLGIGVCVSAVFVLVFQGLLVLLSMLCGSFLSSFAIAELVAEGSVMILALGMNLIGITKIKVANLLPALILVPFVCLLVQALPL